MNRVNTLTQTELMKLFPSGIPLSVRMLAERKELDSSAKNELMRQIAAENKRPPGTRAANRHAQEIGNTARREAFEEAMDILRTQYLWSESAWLVSKKHMADRIGKRFLSAQRRPYEMGK